MSRKVAKTCVEKYKEALALAQKLFECRPKGSVKHFQQAFFAPEFSPWPEQLENQTAQYLYCRVPCNLGNNAEEVCTCAGCGDCGGCGCGDVSRETGCDDPDQCNTTVIGWNYVQIARAAEHAVSLQYVPFRIREPKPGDVLTWDAQAAPDNLRCDPCIPDKRGAWVNKPASEVL